MKRIVLALVVLVMLAAMPALAQSVVSAADREAIRGVPDKWGFSLGAFWQTFETKVRLNGETADGTEIDFENDFGMDKSLTAFQLGGYYRFSDRHRLDLTYVPWDREKTRTLDEDIQWGDVIYEAGATVNSKAKIQMLNIIYKYSFFNNGKVTFGLNGGVSSLWSNLTLSGEGTISGGGEEVSGTIAESSKVIFPIPVIGVHFDMTLTKRLIWRAEGNFFAASISGYDGNINVLSTSIAYFPTRNVGVGAGFASNLYTVTKGGDNGGEVRVRYGFSGVTAFVQFAF
jgi:hypothetical protein